MVKVLFRWTGDLDSETEELPKLPGLGIPNPKTS
jgi:hypothetical protein